MEVDPQLAELCQLEWPRLVGSLSLYTGDPELAEDLAQETLVRVCQHWSEVRQATSRSAWTHRVAFNLAKSQFRKRAVRRRYQHLEHPEPIVHDADTPMHLAVRDAVAALPDPQRRALVLRYFTDLSVLETAAVMACPTNTVKTHTRRAIEALRAAGLVNDDTPVPGHVATGGIS